MKRAFLAIAILATSWLPGIGYFHHADSLAFAAMIASAIALLIGTQSWEMDRIQATVAAILCAVATIWISSPYRAIPLLIACGLGTQALPIPVRWPRAIGSAAIGAGTILLVQSAALFAYTNLTARSHELPFFLSAPIVAVAKVIGITSANTQTAIPLGTMRVNHLMGATWELLVDPASLCFVAGAIVWIGWRNWRGLLVLLACVIAWIPARIALLLGLYMHRALRWDFDTPLAMMDQFWNTPLHLLLLAGPALLAWRLVPMPPRPSDPAPPARTVWLGALLGCAGMIAIAMALYWNPIGTRNAGRVMVYELKDPSDPSYKIWEPTEDAFDTNSYGHNAAYTYKVLYDYLTHFYDVSRLNTRIDDDAIKACDVLIIKVPTKRLDQHELASIKRFVSRGGGLLLVGEHTDVFGTGTFLNDVASGFGFAFRYDCLFDIDEVFQQKHRPDVVPHPIVQNLPELDYAVTCSIDPKLSDGRGAMVSTGLRSLPADYHASNFYPQVEDRADARYGSFVQLWSMRYNAGRVVAFSDSTEFSNFCLFDPGKSELFLGMVEWLNHRSSQNDPRWPLAGIGAMALLGACVLAQGRPRGMLVAAAGGLFGFAIAVPSIGMIQKQSMPLPKPVRELKRVVMDRTVCDSTLPLAGFIAGKSDGFGIFERWNLRLGYFIGRRSGAEALKDNLLVFAYPTKSVPAEFRESLAKYVDGGGRILVIDSAENQASTANSLLAPFNIRLKRDAALQGDLTLAAPSTQPTTTQPATSPTPIAITNAVEVTTIDPAKPEVLASITEKPVCTTIRHGKGSVTVLGYGSRFADANYGFTGDNAPDAAMRAAYQVQFDLVRKIVEEK